MWYIITCPRNPDGVHVWSGDKFRAIFIALMQGHDIDVRRSVTTAAPVTL